ncbi:MAG: hypothetical protein FWD14_06140 [Treponema sp.]|nr:hypothetical protein [Treponema sp.]
MGDNKFISGGYDARISYSSNGINWTHIPSGTANDTTTTFGNSSNIAIHSIAYGDGMFVAVGDEGKIAYSSNDINWTAITPGAENGTTTTFSSSNIYGITYENGRFIAGGTHGRMAYSNVVR